MAPLQKTYGAVGQPSSTTPNNEGGGGVAFSRFLPSWKVITAITVTGLLTASTVFALPYHHHHVPPPTSSRTLSNGTHEYHPTVIMISLDGTVNDDLDLSITPHLSSIADHGVRAQWLTPSFPPITFPNHWSLVTGLYPESHGVIYNVFYDPIMNETFNYKDPAHSHDKKWWGGEPIWNTAVRQNRTSGVIMWPGCSTVFDDDLKPTIEVPYNDDMTPEEKMDLTLEWLDMPIGERPEFIAVYIPQIDQAGHRYGPYAKQTLDTLHSVDTSVGRLLEGLAARHLDEIVNVIVVSDHGMSATSKSRLIFYDDVLTPNELSMIERIEGYPLLSIWPTHKEHTESLYQAFLRLQKVHPEFQVYKRDQIPERYHFQHHVRIPPLLVVPNAGWLMTTHDEYPDLDAPLNPRGVHGYDNLHPESRAIFVASGPFFEKHYESGSMLKPFWNIEVHNLVADILDIEPAPNNGTLKGGLLEKE